MTSPIALGRGPLPPSPPENRAQRKDWRTVGDGDSLLTARTPAKTVPTIDRNKVDPQIRKAAEGMEAMFLDYMFKVMRDTVPKENMDLESPASGIYRGMLDSEYAQKAARTGGIGLADQIIAYMQQQRYTQERGKSYPSQVTTGQGKAPSNDPTVTNRLTGGTHEGQSARE